MRHVSGKMETKSMDGYGGHAGVSWNVMWMGTNRQTMTWLATEW